MKKRFYVVSVLLSLALGQGAWANVNDGNVFKGKLNTKALVINADKTFGQKTKQKRAADEQRRTSWDFVLSDSTATRLERSVDESIWAPSENIGWNDASFVANFYYNEGYYGPLMTRSVSDTGEYEELEIPETNGLYFGSSQSGIALFVELFTGATGGMRLNVSTTWVVMQDLQAGQFVTIRYKTSINDVYKGDDESDNTIGFVVQNLEYVSGAETNGTEEYQDVVFRVKEDGAISFAPSTGLEKNGPAMLIQSINIGEPNYVAALDELRANVSEYMENALADYPGMKAELNEAYEASAYTDEATSDELAEKRVALNTAYNTAKQALAFIEQLNTDIATAETILAAPTEGVSTDDLAAALAATKTIDAQTAKAADYLALQLPNELAMYQAMSIPRDQWNFNRSYNTSDYNYSIDETHKLASWNGFRKDYPEKTFDVPMFINVNGERYPIVQIKNQNTYNQYTLETITLPKTLRYIDNYAFSSFYKLRSIDIPANVDALGSDVFYNSNKLKDIYLHRSTPIAASSNITNSARLHVPDGSFHTYRLSNVWNALVIVTETPVEVSVELADGGELGRLVLEQAGYLQEVNKLTVKGRLNSDDWASLKNMTNLVEVDLSGLYNTEIPSNQFYNKWAISKVVLPANLATIGSNAFRGTDIKEMTLPETVTTINNYAFYECNSLEHIVLSEGLTAMGSNAFYGCKLKELSLPSTLKEIPSSAFRANTELQKITFAEGLTKIGDYAFYNCAVDSLQLPSTLVSIQNNAFNSCKKLKSVVCNGSLKNIEYSAFYNCTSLDNVELNEGLQSIGENAFCNCKKLTEITLPSSLQKCMRSPFSGCTSLTKIYANSVLPPTTDGYVPITNVDMTAVTLYVPTWSLESYQLADGWSQFYTFEVTDYMPQNVVINKDFVFSLRDELPDDYRPNINMMWSDTQKQNDNGSYYYERGNLTVNSRSKLPVNDFTMYLSPYAKYYKDCTWNDITKYNPTSLIVNGEMRAENVVINLMNYQSRWQFISFPFDVKMSDIVPVDEATQWVVREYSGYNRAQGDNSATWINLTSDDVLKAGKGYIMQCYNGSTNTAYDSNMAIFSVSPVKESVNRQAIFIATDRSVQLEENLSEFEHNRSWNLIGNPYPSFYDTRFLDFEGILTVWNSYNKSYQAYSPVDDSYILSPGEAFFVQRPVDQESITFAKAGRQTYDYARILDEPVSAMRRAADQTARLVCNVTLSDGENLDRTRVVLNEKATMQYELTRDASKFMSTNPAMPQIYSVNNGVRYAINERPQGDGIIELGLYAGKNGVYTIGLAADVQATVVLEDRQTGAFVTLTATDGYTFEAEAGEIAGRFYLHAERKNDATGIDSVATDNAADAPAYNVEGQRVDAKTYKGIIVRGGKKTVNKK